MAIMGGCSCRNIEIAWQTIDRSLVPRACQCSFCTKNNARYVSKSGTRVNVSVRKPALHQQTKLGSEQALFHSCTHCGDLVLVTAQLDDTRYGAVNAAALRSPEPFAKPIEVDYSGDTAETKVQRWRDNWCYPVVFN